MAATAPSGESQIASRFRGVAYSLFLGDCAEWMEAQAANSIHAIVTDPPYGLKEYTHAEKEKLRKGRGGIWRIPPAFDGCTRSPVRGRLNPPPEHALESKASTRTWALQSHYDHPGWYIVWRYGVDQTKRMKPGKLVAVWRVDVAFLNQEDWKYEGSNATEGRGGRTHTFGVRKPAKRFRSSIVYQSPRIVIRQGGPVLARCRRVMRGRPHLINLPCPSPQSA